MANPEPIKFLGVKEALRTMQQIEPEMYKQLRKDIRSITAPAVSAVKSAVPTVAPLSGMNHNGRTAWNGVNVTTNITPGQRSRAFGSTTANLVAISSTGKNGQYGFNIADMAGRGSGRGSRPKNITRPYQRNGRTVQHRLNGQGQAMIRNLGRPASRYVYPAIEGQLPAIIGAVAQSIQTACESINRKLEIV